MSGEKSFYVLLHLLLFILIVQKLIAEVGAVAQGVRRLPCLL